MPLPQFFGTCGRNNPRPCKIAWASIDTNNRVGTYPSQFLPTKRTIWHATTQGGYSFTPPVISPGDSFGLPILNLFTSTGALSVQFDTFTPSTRLVFSFVRTANRINVAHILTQSEIDSANLENQDSSGIADIDVGEFVFEVISATDSSEEIISELTDEEKQQLGDLQSETDRIFRKLFEKTIENNRFVGVKVNKEGIEYRLDNGGPKAISALDDSARGFFVGANAANTYRDGSSRIIQVNLKQPVNYGTSNRPVRAGDVIYLSYVAIKEHYIRQSINVKWALTAISLPPQCFGYPTGLKHASFRFYQWNVNPDNPNDQPVRVSGWRVVETDNIPVNFLSMMGVPGESVIGNLMIGGGTGQLTVPYMPTNVTISELRAFTLNRASLPTYFVDVDTGNKYQNNIGKKGQQTNTYSNSSWYSRRGYNTYLEDIDAREKVFFNIHPEALLKRDVDKFGIEQTLAQEIETEIAAGRPTFVPFMDDKDPAFSNPTEGSKDYLSSLNLKFSPVQPVSRWTISNAEIDCAVGGGIALGFNSGFNGFGDVLGVFGINSNIITERFEKDTKVLIEKFDTEGQFDPQILAIEGLSSPRGSVSCVTDSMGLDSVVVHSDREGILRFSKFKNNQIMDSLRVLEYRPDLPAPSVADNMDPNPSQFEPLLGYSGMLGDNPGTKPGLAISASSVIDKSKIKYSTNSFDRFKFLNPQLKITEVSIISFEKTGNKVTIPVGTRWHGNLTFEYEYEGDNQEVLILIKFGGISGSIDSVFITDTGDLQKTISIDFKWMKCDSIEIVGSNFDKLNVTFVSITSLDDSVADDFLAIMPTRNDSDKNLISNNKFYDKNILFQTEVMSIDRSNDGKFFVFFNDRDGGISCAQTNDRGDSWIYQYGIVEPMKEIQARHPFVIHSDQNDLGYLFYSMNGKILCKKIPYSLFLTEDSMLVERFEKDRLVVNEIPPDTIKLGLYSPFGNVLRRQKLSYVAAGDLSDPDFLSLLGKVPEQGISEPEKEYSVETSPGIFSNIKQLVNPISIGTTTAFSNQDVSDPFFSASLSDEGELGLWYLSESKQEIGGGQQLQCHFSKDGGINWYDKWEFIENSYNRIRADKNKKTQFVDWSSSGDPVQNIFSNDPLESQQLASWGINIHWSRMKSHKVNQATTSWEDESVVLPVSCPYVIFHPFLKQFFVFYIYEGCLLCKIFYEGLMATAAERKRRYKSDPEDGFPVGMSYLKKIIEQGTRSHFIDGNLSNPNILKEIHYYIDPSTNERQVQGNIIYPFLGGLNVFNEERNISSQRVCAYRYDRCNLRVFYKLEQSPDLKSATWNGGNWFVEELMKRSPQATPTKEETGAKDVTGGFGSDGYGPEK